MGQAQQRSVRRLLDQVDLDQARSRRPRPSLPSQPKL